MAKDGEVIEREQQLGGIIDGMLWSEWVDGERYDHYAHELPVMWRVDAVQERTKDIMWAPCAQEIPWWHGTWKSPSLSRPGE
jgi:hypothetical protein